MKTNSLRRAGLLSFGIVFGVMMGAGVAQGEDLGTKAQTYALDPDAREEIRSVMRHKQATGELDQFWKNYRNRVLDSIKSPPSLGIRTDYGTRTELHDLRFVMPQDYRDQNGKVVVRKGTVVDPLKALPLTMGLLFIDGNDPRQVDWAVERSRAEPLKIVLTAGSAYLMRIKYRNVDWHGVAGVPFYLDQRKIIINTLRKLYGIGISSVPVALYQKGDQLALQFGMGAGN
ncbi:MULTISPECIES: conjugal transfer protein [Paraburkholderia]|uniref:Conjugal transfer protein n=1 Tax=Paraburkholderia madseniana TaxID=2599607 RepID=A0AAP5BL42_9BURK|nr:MULTISPECIES: conjugal transfer protein [Paraburkholderia]MCX4151042.1 conjugal transfer protein [Paraburkholderia madseniana]MCX4176682.1 conjugal transfer protein [Paraburkholderia madseniana]MDN7153974.1 conjugal transfer protein [Paraburkholderia sp. WS6]MDQ6412856.1 conjugal transfer protein [Paraburkholderia madseniana]MDQ6464673.1 conjugal transfer protein [Paraburkholderia madseniana]